VLASPPVHGIIGCRFIGGSTLGQIQRSGQWFRRTQIFASEAVLFPWVAPARFGPRYVSSYRRNESLTLDHSLTKRLPRCFNLLLLVIPLFCTLRQQIITTWEADVRSSLMEVLNSCQFSVSSSHHQSKSKFMERAHNPRPHATPVNPSTRASGHLEGEVQSDM